MHRIVPGLRNEKMDIGVEQVRRYRLRGHHLDRKLPPKDLLAAAGACGVQNSPPGVWETALFNRLEDCCLRDLRWALEEEKTLLQAWSYRGVPVVFPTAESGVFLTPLVARPGEEPWIYTRGITLALDFLGMTFEELLPLVEEAVRTCLADQSIRSKEALDQALADAVCPGLPPEKQALWDAPSMYGRPDWQTVGGAVVSFLLRPCAFSSLVVFGARQEGSPVFTSFSAWTGQEPAPCPDGERELVRKYLRCYGPSTAADFAAWLGSSPKQARRLWNSLAEELMPVQVEGRTRYLPAGELDALTESGGEEERLLLLGPHDPYLDLRDRWVVLPDPALQRRVWRTVSNPGALVQDGKILGTWTAKVRGERMELRIDTWDDLTTWQRRQAEEQAQAYAAFRERELAAFCLDRGH